jgi:hypothetical protein
MVFNVEEKIAVQSYDLFPVAERTYGTCNVKLNEMRQTVRSAQVLKSKQL